MLDRSKIARYGAVVNRHRAVIAERGQVKGRTLTARIGQDDSTLEKRCRAGISGAAVDQRHIFALTARR